MREIKFRAWHEVRLCNAKYMAWCKKNGLYLGGDISVLREQEAKFKAESGIDAIDVKFLMEYDINVSSKGKMMEMEGSDCYGENGEAVLMQYTGLKDSNGKEIYEGDILLIDYQNSEYSSLDNEYHEVVWCGGDYPAFDLKRHEFESNGLSYLKGTCLPFYVVGNICENPELLEGVK